jgi:hypothetical protein
MPTEIDTRIVFDCLACRDGTVVYLHSYMRTYVYAVAVITSVVFRDINDRQKQHNIQSYKTQLLPYIFSTMQFLGTLLVKRRVYKVWDASVMMFASECCWDKMLRYPSDR